MKRMYMPGEVAKYLYFQNGVVNRGDMLKEWGYDSMTL